MRVAISPILWYNEDLPDLMPPVDAATIADEVAAAGYEGVERASARKGRIRLVDIKDVDRAVPGGMRRREFGFIDGLGGACFAN